MKWAGVSAVNHDIRSGDAKPITTVAHGHDQGLALGIGEPCRLERVAQLADQILGLTRRRAFDMGSGGDLIARQRLFQQTLEHGKI